LQELLNLNAGKDFKLAHTFTERHINVKGSEQMNVRLAVNVFSNTVSKSLSFCGQQQMIDKYNWKEVSSVLIYKINLSCNTIHTIRLLRSLDFLMIGSIY